MLNQHNGRRLNEKTGKESMPKQKESTIAYRKKNVSKKYRCCECSKKLPTYALVEQPANKHGKVFICYKCLKNLLKEN